MKYTIYYLITLLLLCCPIKAMERKKQQATPLTPLLVENEEYLSDEEMRELDYIVRSQCLALDELRQAAFALNAMARENAARDVETKYEATSEDIDAAKNMDEIRAIIEKLKIEMSNQAPKSLQLQQKILPAHQEEHNNDNNNHNRFCSIL
jgi:hypothetical protein